MSVIMCNVPKFYNLYFLVHFRVLFDKQLIIFFRILCAFTYSRLVLSAFLKGLSLLKVFWGNWGTVAVADPDLQIRGGGGGWRSSLTLRKEEAVSKRKNIGGPSGLSLVEK